MISILVKSSLITSSPSLVTRLSMIFLFFELLVLEAGEGTCHLVKVRPRFLSSVLEFKVTSSETPFFCLSTMIFRRLRLVSSPSIVLSMLPRASVPIPYLKLRFYSSAKRFLPALFTALSSFNFSSCLVFFAIAYCFCCLTRAMI